MRKPAKLAKVDCYPYVWQLDYAYGGYFIEIKGHNWGEKRNAPFGASSQRYYRWGGKRNLPKYVILSRKNFCTPWR